jgi:hypothetical protein
MARLVQCVVDDGKDLVGIERLGDEPAAPAARVRAFALACQLACCR